MTTVASRELRNHTAEVLRQGIAAIAKANGMDVVARDDDFEVIAQVGGPMVIRV